MKKSFLFVFIFFLLGLNLSGSSTGYDMPDRFFDDLTPTHERITNEAFRLFCSENGGINWNDSFGVLLDHPIGNCSDLYLSNSQMDYEEYNSLYPYSPVRSVILGSRYPDLFEYPPPIPSKKIHERFE